MSQFRRQAQKTEKPEVHVACTVGDFPASESPTKVSRFNFDKLPRYVSPGGVGTLSKFHETRAPFLRLPVRRARHPVLSSTLRGRASRSASPCPSLSAADKDGGDKERLADEKSRERGTSLAQSPLGAAMRRGGGGGEGPINLALDRTLRIKRLIVAGRERPSLLSLSLLSRARGRSLECDDSDEGFRRLSFPASGDASPGKSWPPPRRG